MRGGVNVGFTINVWLLTSRNEVYKELPPSSIFSDWDVKLVTAFFAFQFHNINNMAYAVGKLFNPKYVPINSLLKNFWLNGASTSCQIVLTSHCSVVGKRLKEKDQSFWCSVIWRARPLVLWSREMVKVLQSKVMDDFFLTIRVGERQRKSVTEGMASPRGEGR